MKKIAILASALLIALSFMMVSCKNDSDSSSGSGSSGSTTSPASIVGKWESDWGGWIRFNNDGTWKADWEDGSGTYTYYPENNGYIALTESKSGEYFELYCINGTIFIEGDAYTKK